MGMRVLPRRKKALQGNLYARAGEILENESLLGGRYEKGRLGAGAFGHRFELFGLFGCEAGLKEGGEPLSLH